jgi:Fur family transcriptional regulator, ferric uptake regulator
MTDSSKGPEKRRNSARRTRILEHLQDVDRFLSSQEIHKQLKSQGQSLGLATVYRQLEILVEEGQLDSIVSPKGEKLFRHCGVDEDHHHHIICRKCGMTKQIEISEVEEMAELAGRKYKFKDVTHSLEIFGLCEKCSKR